MKTALAIPRRLSEMGADITLFSQCLGGKQCRFASQSFSHSVIVKGPTPLVCKRDRHSRPARRICLCDGGIGRFRYKYHFRTLLSAKRIRESLGKLEVLGANVSLVKSGAPSEDPEEALLPSTAFLEPAVCAVP